MSFSAAENAIPEWLSLWVGYIYAFFLQFKVLCSYTHALSNEHFHTDALEGAIQVLRNADGGGGCKIFQKKEWLSAIYSDNCCTETILPTSDHAFSSAIQIMDH